jgi:hypothetical protein
MSWADSEFQDASFGDDRLRQRAIRVCERLAEHPSESIPVACCGRAEVEAAYRFFSNDKVTAARVLGPHHEASFRRLAAHPVVLCVQDTTELDYTGKQTAGLGPLNYAATNGLYLHVTTALTPQRQALGIVAQEFFVHDRACFGQATKRAIGYYARPIDEKESGRWLRAFESLCEIAGLVPETRLICLCDCEADIYELLATAAKQAADQPRVEYVIRSQFDRTLVGEGSLRAFVQHQPVLGEIDFQVAATPTRRTRLVRQTVRVAPVCLKAPAGKESWAGCVSTTAIFLTESRPPAGEAPVEWLLLSSQPVTTLADAVETVKWYLCRWEVEVYFRIYKSGCRVERLQLEISEHLEPALAMYMIIAWRIQSIVMLGRAYPDLPCDVVFDDLEWRTAFVIRHHRPPTAPPSLADMIIIIASFGGYLARKSDPPPGPKAIWIGLQRLRDFVVARTAFDQINQICVE